MKKRLIALAILVCMLVSVSPTVAADDTVPRPTVEEILSEYHEKAFEAETADESGDVSAYSRGADNSEKTLEEETVDTLNAAGYEAYNVTSENYATLEEQLQTDFAQMGMDPDGSYIIAISGEDNSPGNNARIPTPEVTPTLPPEGGGGSSYFSYTYQGTTYYMRYVTVTATEKSVLDRMFAFAVNRGANTQTWNTLFSAFITYQIDGMIEDIPIVSILSLIDELTSEQDITASDCNGFLVTGATTWTLQYIQVYDFYNDEWVSSQCSEYAITTAQTQIYKYNANQPHTIYYGEVLSFRTDSEYYNNSAKRKEFAADYYLCGTCMLDYTGDIVIRVNDPSTGANYYIGEDIDDNSATSYSFIRDHWSFHW